MFASDKGVALTKSFNTPSTDCLATLLNPCWPGQWCIKYCEVIRITIKIIS